MFATNWFSSLKSGRRSGRANAKLAYGEVLETRQLLSAEVVATPTGAMGSDQGNKPAESQSSVDRHQIDSDFLHWIQTTENSSNDSKFKSTAPQTQATFGFSVYQSPSVRVAQGDNVHDVESRGERGFFSEAIANDVPYGGSGNDVLKGGSGNDPTSGGVESGPKSKSPEANDQNNGSETPASGVTMLPSDDLSIWIERRNTSAVGFSQNQTSPSLAFEINSAKWIDQIFQDSTRGANDFFSNLERENAHRKSAVAPDYLGRNRPTESLTGEFGSRIDPNQSVSQNAADRVRSREDHFFILENGKLVEITAPELRQELLGSKADAALNPSEMIGAGFGFTPSEWPQLRSRDAQMLDRSTSQSGRRRTAMDFIQWRD